MATRKDKKIEKQRKVLSARKRVEQHEASSGRTTLAVPSGVGFFQVNKAGSYRFDILPFTVGKGNPAADEGEAHFERTYYVHRSVGANNDSFVCPAKTFGKPCPICEYRAKLTKEGGDEDTIKSLAPKDRQLWAVWDHADPDKGPKIWDVSFHLFGKFLYEKIKNADDEDGYEYFPDAEQGLTLKVGAREEKGGGYTFYQCADIEFKPRKQPIPSEILESVPCLDDLLKEVSYDDLKKIFLQTAHEESNGKSKTKAKAKPKPNDDDEDEDEAPKKKTPTAPKTAGGWKVGDIVLYKGMECEVLSISTDGKLIVLEDEEGEDYRVKDFSALSAVKARGGKGKDKEEEEEEDDKEVDTDDDEDEDVDEEDDEDDDDEEDEEDEEDSKPVKKPAKKTGR